MAVDATRLAGGLTEYAMMVRDHLRDLRSHFDELDRRWAALNGVYEGAAASEFRHHWQQTVARFDEYQIRGERIVAVLEEAIGALVDFDRPGGL